MYLQGILPEAEFFLLKPTKSNLPKPRIFWVLFLFDFSFPVFVVFWDLFTLYSMEILILSSLLGIGLVLLLVEVLFIPGTTVVGVLGFLVSLAGVAYTFISFEYDVALWITAIAALLNLIAVWYGFSSGVWNKFSLKSSISGGAFDDRTVGLSLGMKGKAISDLKPYGKISLDDKIFEVKSEEGFIEVGTEVEIIKIEHNKISVK